MTVAISTAYSSATGNGTNKVFSFDFRVQTTAEVQVYVNGVLQGSGYTVALNVDGLGKLTGGGTITFTAAPANNAKVVVASFPLFTQTTSFENAGEFLPAVHDLALDRAAERDIYMNARIDRAIRVPWGETAATLPDATTRANKFLSFDATGAVTVGTAAGAAGPTGPAGPTGAQGPTGPAAQNPNYTYVINTLAAGSSATLSASGTYPNVTLTFGIPRGDSGGTLLPNGDYGDITVSSAGATLTIDAGVITLAKMANLAANSFIGNNTGSSATPIALTVSQAKTLLALVKGDVGLSNVDNTSDANKPVSTAQQTAIDLKVSANNAALTGVPTAPTAALRTATTQIASTAFADRFYDIPPVSKSSSYTLALADRGGTISTTANFNVPSYASVAIPQGAAIEVYNNSDSPITGTLTGTGTTLRKHGSTSTSTTLTLAARSFGTLRKPASNTEWVAVGFS